MDISTMIAAVRRDIREQTPVSIGDTEITSLINLGADFLWEALLKTDESYGRERTSLSSYSNVFTLPTNHFRITSVWDMRRSAVTITDATNADPIVVTSNDHGFSDDEIVRVNGVLGNTNADGQYNIANVTPNTFELEGRAGNAAYTSGGKAFIENSDFVKMKAMNPREATGKRRYEYYVRGTEIVADWISFSDDLILDYLRTAVDYNDIPARYHVGLVSYAIMQLGRPISQSEPNSDDISNMIEFHKGRYQAILTNILTLGDQDGAPIEFNDSIFWDSL
jgi:hypothetical protein